HEDGQARQSVFDERRRAGRRAYHGAYRHAARLSRAAGLRRRAEAPDLRDQRRVRRSRRERPVHHGVRCRVSAPARGVRRDAGPARLTPRLVGSELFAAADRSKLQRTMTKGCRNVHDILTTWLERAVILWACSAALAHAQSTSVLPELPQDPRAVVVTAAGDGVTDDSAAIQAAIDESFRRGGGGIVFVPSGRYRLTRTVFIWPGVRVFGTGPTRPVFVLAEDTPGFQDGLATMIMFSGSNPDGRGFPPAFPPPDSVPFNPNIADANPATAFPALGTVDIEIGDGNLAAIGVRFHAAQHAYLSDIDFHIGSGLAGVYMVGNVMQDVRFFGGRYGILTEKPSAAWPFTLVDALFESQRSAAVREHEAGLTLDNVTFRDVPVGVEIDRGYGDWLFGRNLRFENVSDAAVVVSNEENVYTQVNFQ